MESDPTRIWTTHEDMKTSPPPTRNGSAAADNHDFSRNSYLVGVQSRFRRKYYNKLTNHKIIYMILALIILLLVIAVIVIACLLSMPDDVCHSKECLRASATMLQNMDFRANPCEDFFQFTCGNFDNEHPRLDSQTSHDWFTEKQGKILRDIRKKLVTKPNEKVEPVPVTKARMLFQSCLDSSAIDKLQFDPLFRYLKDYKLPKVPSLIMDPAATDFEYDWIKSIVKIKRSLGADKLIGFEIFPDPKNRTQQYLAIGSPSQENELPLIEDTLAKRLKRLRRKWSIARSEKDDEDEVNLSETEVALLAYQVYMKEVITAIMKAADPKGDIEGSLEHISKAIKSTVDMSKKIYNFIDAAENASKAEDSNGNLSDLVYIKVSELQKIVDDGLAADETLPVFEKYLTQMMNGIPEASFEMDQDVILTSNADILYLKLAIKFIQQTPPQHLEMFIWWSVIEDLILYTTSSMRELYYEYSRTITGIDGTISRSGYCTSSVNKLMGYAVSYLIVEDGFMENTKPKVEKMIENIRRSFNNLVNHAGWMDYDTKQSTLKKSQRMKSLIGFPEWIVNRTLLEKHYQGINIKANTWLENIVSLMTWDFMEKIAKWRMPNKFDWATSPTNVNAFHTFQANTITIPLAILQFPFYQLGLELECTSRQISGSFMRLKQTVTHAQVEEKAKAFQDNQHKKTICFLRALNYGSIGSILAHELTHGFDDIGRHFDEEGNKKYWWSNSTISKFINRTECFKKQYSEYYLPEISEYINGELTLGENIADNGGLREAFYAYSYYTKSAGKEPKLPGFETYTPEQLFFMSFGNLWCETMTATGLKFALEDSHCPGKIRLLGVLSNFREFHNAFECHPGQKYHRTDDQKCIIW